ncbi:MAG: tail fiber domain-containing protein [Chitinophagaceae bacterium]|nr:tail fiber domain-containing protein [Chitinophagaceae bacterium]
MGFKRLSAYCCLSLFFLQAWTQRIGIGTDNPHHSALLEVRSNSKGLLLPRINLLSETDSATIINPLNSLLIYNMNPVLPDGAGYYFWNGNKWSKLATRSNLDNLTWSIGGNSGTSPAANFIGTTDNNALVFKTNNILSGKIDPGPNNVFLGQSAGISNSSGINNTFLGHIAGENNGTGSGNVFAGHFAGNLNYSGSENVFIGQEAGKNNSNGNKNVFTGEDAGISNTTGSDNTFVGNGAGRDNTTASGNIAVGMDALSSNTTGRGNISIGKRALFTNQTLSGLLAIGDSAMYFTYTANIPSPNYNGPINNIAIGTKALYRNTHGVANTAVGWESMRDNVQGDSNTATGLRAMEGNTYGNYNAAFGHRALSKNTTGGKNTAVGCSALLNYSGEFNTGVGYYSFSGGFNDYYGENNTAIGAFAGPEVDNLDNTTCLGVSAQVTTSNTMVFGNSGVDRWAFGLTTTNAQHALEVGDQFGNGNGAYLTQGGIWTNASDINKKEGFMLLDKTDLLKKIASLSITRWKYKGSEEYHIGPMAQDFHKIFAVGVDDKGISTVDPAGIALAAIQQLIKENEELRKQLTSIQKDVQMLKEALKK